MNGRSKLAGVTALTSALVVSCMIPIGAQAPRTPDGRPDLQGIWSFSTATPFERPEELADKEFLTPAEASELVKKIVAGRNKDVRGPENRSLRGAVHHGVQRRSADGAERLQQQRADRADARPRHAAERDDSSRPRDSAR